MIFNLQLLEATSTTPLTLRMCHVCALYLTLHVSRTLLSTSLANGNY